MKVYENASIIMVRLNTTSVLQITQLLPTVPQEEENVKAISLLSDVIIRADNIDDNGTRHKIDVKICKPYKKVKHFFKVTH